MHAAEKLSIFQGGVKQLRGGRVALRRVIWPLEWTADASRPCFAQVCSLRYSRPRGCSQTPIPPRPYIEDVSYPRNKLTLFRRNGNFALSPEATARIAVRSPSLKISFIVFLFQRTA